MLTLNLRLRPSPRLQGRPPPLGWPAGRPCSSSGCVRATSCRTVCGSTWSGRRTRSIPSTSLVYSGRARTTWLFMLWLFHFIVHGYCCCCSLSNSIFVVHINYMLYLTSFCCFCLSHFLREFEKWDLFLKKEKKNFLWWY